MRGIMAGIVLLLGVSPAHAQGYAVSGFVNGQVFRALPYESRVLYAQGLLDGMLSAGLYGGSGPELSIIVKCTEGMTGQQITAIFDNFLSAHPERWQVSMNWIAYRSIQDACKST